MTEADFVTVPVTEKMYKRAHDRAYNIGQLKNSITKGGGNVAACLGEDAVKTYLSGSYSRGKNKKDYDMVVNKKKIEVKTKRRTVKPKLNYEVSVAQTSRHQKPDIYVFTSVTYKQEKPFEVVILGYLEYDQFIESATFVPKNKLDTSNGFKCHANMYNLTHDQLKPINELLNVLPSPK